MNVTLQLSPNDARHLRSLMFAQRQMTNSAVAQKIMDIVEVLAEQTDDPSDCVDLDREQPLEIDAEYGFFLLGTLLMMREIPEHSAIFPECHDLAVKLGKFLFNTPQLSGIAEQWKVSFKDFKNFPNFLDEIEGKPDPYYGSGKIALSRPPVADLTEAMNRINEAFSHRKRKN